MYVYMYVCMCIYIYIHTHGYYSVVNHYKQQAQASTAQAGLSRVCISPVTHKGQPFKT